MEGRSAMIIGRWLVVCAASVALAHAATAATWKCVGNTSIVTAQFYLVPTLCQATGAYTTGGDPFVSGPGVELCNSAAKRAVFTMQTSAASATTGQGYAVLYLPAGKIVLLTAGNSPGAGVALVEVAAGTVIDGATVVMLSFCQ
jgi:hypothetical protein